MVITDPRKDEKMIKVLNLYAGIGGNRKLWTDVDVTAVEINPEIVRVYQDFFPRDKVIVGDAHDYLVKHYKEFGFIWSSPPCLSHTRINRNFNRAGYADMTLYQEIIFLQEWFKGKYCVENVIPYYTPLIPFQQIDRHAYWCNFRIEERIVRNPPKESNLVAQRKNKDGRYEGPKIKEAMVRQVFDLTGYRFDTARKDQVLKNCVKPETGLAIFNYAFKDLQTVLLQV